jgi:putative iron-only hydrogenase system regulator
MGVPYRERGLSVISLIIDGSTDKVGAMTGKLGRLEGVKVKTALLTI